MKNNPLLKHNLELILFLILVSSFLSLTKAQEDIQIGKSLNTNQQYNRGARFDYSDPDAN